MAIVFMANAKTANKLAKKMTSAAEEQKSTKVPRRPFGTALSNDRLPATLPIVGLGCSSFSTFFWTADDHLANTPVTVDNTTKDHPKVQEWIETIRYAVVECGITLLDTAPWYGHGTSEVVVGFALEQHAELRNIRADITINTKVGRYEADPLKQFDFSRDSTIQSIQRSLKRLQCQYIDVLQLHDPEFAPSLDLLMNESIPAMMFAQEQGWCKALGMTGYPLQVQYQILQKSLQVFGKNIWDQALTYGHFNLHNTRLTSLPIGEHESFASYCKTHNMGLLAAAPLSMGLLTPPNADGTLTLADWHPACAELKEACRQASLLCQKEGVNLATLATVFALSNPQIASTIIGCKSVAEVQRAADVAKRYHHHDATTSTNNDSEVTNTIMTFAEQKVLQQLQDVIQGPFANVWKNDLHHWDGIGGAQEFWKEIPSVKAEHWHDRSLISPKGDAK